MTAQRLHAVEPAFIANTGNQSYLPDVEFSPDGEYFAVTVRDQNLVRLHRSASHEIVGEYGTQPSCLDQPHGLAVTNRHLIVSSKGTGLQGKSFLTSFRLEPDAPKPVSTVDTPLKGLFEPHSLAIHEDRLFVTYCGGELNGLAAFEWDDATGHIGALIGVSSDCFDGYGHPKGVAVDVELRKLYVSFTSEKPFPLTARNLSSKVRRYGAGIGRTWSRSADFGHFCRQVIHGYRNEVRKFGGPKSGGINNGLMIFGLDAADAFDAPEQIIVSQTYTRYENIDVKGPYIALADPLNNRVSLFAGDKIDLDNPVLTISDKLSFPHDVALSPVDDQLVISNYGITTHDDEVMWDCFDEERSDRLAIFHVRP